MIIYSLFHGASGYAILRTTKLKKGTGYDWGKMRHLQECRFPLGCRLELWPDHAGRDKAPIVIITLAFLCLSLLVNDQYPSLPGRFFTNHLLTAILNWHFNHSFYSVTVDGGWSRWSVWTTCTKSCESGTQTRSRSCTQPPPQHGGRTCPGAARDQRVCNTQSCPGMQFNRHLFLLLPIIAPLRESSK